MGVHIVPEETRTPQQVRGVDQPRYGGRGRRSVAAVRGVVTVHDVGQAAQTRAGAQRGGERERTAVAAVQQPLATPILPTGAVQPERPGARGLRDAR